MYPSITEPLKLYDMRESFFDTYRRIMNPFFKHAEGEIMQYSEMKKNALYKEPIYSSEDRACIGDKARKFVMYSDTDW